MFLQADALRLPFADQTFDLVIGSPPYTDCRKYLEDGKDLGISRDTEAWVEWMLDVSREALRVSKGLVVWVAAGPTRGRNYQPAVEGLMWRWFLSGGHAYRPVYWHRVGIPGSGGDQWYRADIEYCVAMKRPGKLPYANPKANGKPPKYPGGGCVSYRDANGDRKADGRTAMPDIANPGNLLHTNAGGGHTGPKMALDGNEAPFPPAIPEFFIRSHCAPGGLVLDPFSGSGSTAHAAANLGRRYVGCDLRMSQCLLGRRRMASVTPGLPFAA